jgi:hypothetical protein
MAEIASFALLAALQLFARCFPDDPSPSFDQSCPHPLSPPPAEKLSACADVHEDDGSLLITYGICIALVACNQLVSTCNAKVSLRKLHNLLCLPPFSALSPGATRCRTACLCYATIVSIRQVAYCSPSASFPCTRRYGVQGRGKERSTNRCGPSASERSRAAST